MHYRNNSNLINSQEFCYWKVLTAQFKMHYNVYVKQRKKRILFKNRDEWVLGNVTDTFKIKCKRKIWKG